MKLLCNRGVGLMLFGSNVVWVFGGWVFSGLGLTWFGSNVVWVKCGWVFGGWVFSGWVFSRGSEKINKLKLHQY